MHIILRDRGLAHWRAVNSLTEARLARVQARFASEQPALAEFIARTATESSRPDTLREFASALAEIFRREARHPLATVSEAEVERRWDEILDFIVEYEAAEQQGKKSNQDLVRTCHQESLMLGVTAAYLAESGEKELVSEIALPLLRLTVDCLDAAAGEAAADGKSEWTVDRLEEALSVDNDPLQEEAEIAADDFRAALVPRLLAELDSWISDAQAALKLDGSFGTTGLYLLAKWRETSAWPVFRRLLSLPGKTSLDLTGDIVTQDGPVLVASVVGGQRVELQAMIEDPDANEYCRGACLEAMACLVAWEEMPRAELVAYLKDLLKGRLPEIPENDHVFAEAVSVACDLEAWELLPEIEAAYARGAVDDGFIDWGTVLEFQAGRFGSQWQKFCERHKQIKSIAATTSWSARSEREPDDDDVDADYLPDFLPEETVPSPYVAPPKVGRNDPCPCGSGKKFKKCCGK